MNFLVYKITNLINNKSYIGITTRTLSKRWDEHIAVAFNPSSKDYNAPFKRAIRKYGVSSWKIEVLDNSATNLEELKKLEKYWIKHFNTYLGWKNCQGYNATLGGDGALGAGTIAIDSFDVCSGRKIKSYNSIAEAQLDLGVRIEGIGQLNRSSKGLCFLYHEDIEGLDEQTIIDYVHNLFPCLVYQLDLQGKIVNIYRNTTEAAAAIQCSQGNLISSCEQKRRLCKGYQWAYQRDIANRINQPVKELPTQGKPVVQYTMGGQYIQTWKNITEAARECGNLSDSHISQCCTQQRDSCGGFQWRYLEDNISVLPPLFTKRPVICLETNEIFKTCNQAAKHFGYSQATVKKSCMNKKTTKPFHFAWLDESKIKNKETLNEIFSN